MSLENLPVYPDSIVEADATRYALVDRTLHGQKLLAVAGDSAGFEIRFRHRDDVALCLLTEHNAAVLRERLPWLSPQALGTATSAGFGDRLGLATPGHARAAAGTGVAPVFAQQSVRENTRIGRTPQQVMDAAMWGVLQVGWRAPWGADADHLKTVEDIGAFTTAGYTFFTIDPGDHVNDRAQEIDTAALRDALAALPWDALESSPEDLHQRFLGKTFILPGDVALHFDEPALLRAAVKYGAAVAHTAIMARELRQQSGSRPFDLEVSVDETATATSAREHFYIASELHRLEVAWVSLAPRFVGRFEKGVDYIGDLAELEADIAGHAAVMAHFGDTYKLSLHTGSDKFGVYPLAVKHTGGRVHLKTAGTSYLEALRVIAALEPALFREILERSRQRYEIDRATYHVSGELERVPEQAELNDAQLPALLDQFDARQVLHVTFGSILDEFGAGIIGIIEANEEAYATALQRHFSRHLEAFAGNAQ
jgi:tagaturonate epimerase